MDIQISTDGGPMATVYLFTPLTHAGDRWLQENVQSEPWQWIGRSLGVDHRYATDLTVAAQADGLEVR